MIAALLAVLLSIAPLPASVTADRNGFTLAYTAPDKAVTVCLERRSWPIEADALIGCYPASTSVVMRSPRDLNLQLQPGYRAVITAYDADNAPVARSSVIVGERRRLWLPWTQ